MCVCVSSSVYSSVYLGSGWFGDVGGPHLPVSLHSVDPLDQAQRRAAARLVCPRVRDKVTRPHGHDALQGSPWREGKRTTTRQSVERLMECCMAQGFLSNCQEMAKDKMSVKWSRGRDEKVMTIQLKNFFHGLLPTRNP